MSPPAAIASARLPACRSAACRSCARRMRRSPPSPSTILAFGGDAFRRLMHHELGHFHGEDDVLSAPNRSTVMLRPSTMALNLPDDVTDCDAQRAFDAR